MTIVTDSPALGQLTEAELVECLRAGAIDAAAFAADVERRDQAERRRAAARAGARRRNAEWEAAAYAQYEAASAYCNGDHNMLSDAGKRRGRDAWPMCWEGAEDTARKLASDELITFWDYVQPRVPGPGQYAAAKRAAAAEHAARSDATPARPATRTPSARELAEHAAATATVAPARPPGSIARYITALGHLQRQADKTARAMARVNGGIQR